MAFPARSRDQGVDVATLERNSMEYRLKVLKILENKISYSDLLKLPIPEIDKLLDAQTEINKQEVEEAKKNAAETQ